jgi:hypothetical protein
MKLLINLKNFFSPTFTKVLLGVTVLGELNNAYQLLPSLTVATHIYGILAGSILGFLYLLNPTLVNGKFSLTYKTTPLLIKSFIVLSIAIMLPHSQFYIKTILGESACFGLIAWLYFHFSKKTEVITDINNNENTSSLDNISNINNLKNEYELEKELEHEVSLTKLFKKDKTS